MAVTGYVMLVTAVMRYASQGGTSSRDTLPVKGVLMGYVMPFMVQCALHG